MGVITVETMDTLGCMFQNLLEKLHGRWQFWWGTARLF